MNDSKYGINPRHGDNYEIWSETIPNDKYLIIWVDGENFSKFTKIFKKPFDAQFSQLMRITAAKMMEYGGIPVKLAYTQSDEIALFVGDIEDNFKGRIEKIIARYAGLAIHYFSEAMRELDVVSEKLPLFDCKVILADDYDGAMQFLHRRIWDAGNNFISSKAYWHLRQEENLSPAVAQKTLNEMKTEEKIRLLESWGYSSFDSVTWQRFGWFLKWSTREVEGFNPIIKEHVTVERRDVIPKTTNSFHEMGRIAKENLSIENNI